MVEICQNPFKKDKCTSETIKLYIEYKHKILPICYKCFDKIIDNDLGVSIEEMEEVKDVEEIKDN